jgi:hypothetical protein
MSDTFLGVDAEAMMDAETKQARPSPQHGSPLSLMRRRGDGTLKRKRFSRSSLLTVTSIGALWIFVSQVFFVLNQTHRMKAPTSSSSTGNNVPNQRVLFSEHTKSAKTRKSIKQADAWSGRRGRHSHHGKPADAKREAVGMAKHEQDWMRQKQREHKLDRRKKYDPSKGLQKDPVAVKINFPVFVASLPKSGTTSMWQYFSCGGHHGSHQHVKVNDTHTELAGQCIQRNMDNGRPPFQGCGSYEVFTDTGYALADPERKHPTYPLKPAVDCYYPSIDSLDAFAEYYPSGTLLLVVRDTDSWYKSMAEWGEGSLLKRWELCEQTGFPDVNSDPDDFHSFYDWHTEHVRKFARQHPSLRYIEVSLESEETGRILEREIGIPATCWGKCTPYSKFCERSTTQ